jgi:hypothetical protein
MDIFVGVDTFYVRENQVENFKVEILNLKLQALNVLHCRKVLLQHGD